MSSAIKVASNAATEQPILPTVPAIKFTSPSPPMPHPTTLSTIIRTSSGQPDLSSAFNNIATLGATKLQPEILTKSPSLQTPPIMTPYSSPTLNSIIASPSSTNPIELGANDSSETPSTVTPQQKSNSLNAGQAIGIALGCLIFVLLVGLGVAFLVKRRREKAREKAAQTKGLRDLKLVMAYSETERDISDSWSPAPVSAVSGISDLEGYGRAPPVAEYLQTESARSSTVRLPLTR
ncbi:hypothetical protein TWF694_009860 [Orbilia ellipsospora]|uniref:Uncharacterized protein n=1 Tax=Orbilia ellipsospora TaxID=2528407 RepID=A0AAV9XEU7_9PEZI